MITGNNLKILLLEKNPSVGQLLCEFMQIHDFNADIYSSPENAYEAFVAEGYPVCIISIEEQDTKDAFDFVKKIAANNHNTIIIFLAANPTIETISQAYALGADDFIRKPFILEELNARIRAIVRRSHNIDIQAANIYQIGSFVLDTQKQSLSTADTSNKITTKECELLKYLCKNVNALVLREDILSAVWKNNSYYNARSMDVYITKLRRLLKSDPNVAIVNVHGRGYKLLIITDEQ
jgi:DNA-binding response OmpR family regulator